VRIDLLYAANCGAPLRGFAGEMCLGIIPLKEEWQGKKNQMSEEASGKQKYMR
jgi:hypothetical protein